MKRKFGTGILLLIISKILMVIVGTIGTIYGLGRAFYDTHVGEGFMNIDRKARKLAVLQDIKGAITCSELFNDILIKKDSSYKFNSEETISSTLGKNQLTNTLKPLGWWLVNRLDRIEKDHCLKSIED